MRANTIITLGASLAFGILAVFLARNWISDAVVIGYNQSVPDRPAIQEPKMKTVPVLVVDTPLQFGDEIIPEAVRIVEFPEDAVPEDSFASLNALFIDPEQKTIALRPMNRNEPLLSTNVSGPGAKGSMSARISEGYRGVAIRVDDVSGVAGFIIPGDYVDILFTRDEEIRRNSEDLITDVLLQNIRVLGVDQNLHEGAIAPDIARTVTVEVVIADAQKLHLAMDAGRLSLSLRPLGETMIDATKSITRANIIKPASKPKRTVRRRYTAPKTALSNIASVTIIRGEERDEVSVAREAMADMSLAGG